MFNQSVRHTSELERIVAMPRRTAESATEYADQLSELLRKPGGTMTLRKHQALTLNDVAIYRGAFCGLETGGGKTLITGLAAEILDAKKPMIFQPANLIQKTSEELGELRKHWYIPSNLRLSSYQALGLDDHALMLEDYEPDLLVFDEGHYLKNVHAARTRRVQRYLMGHPDTVVMVLTGTPMRVSMEDYEHLLIWCLGENAPLPRTENEREEWAAALDDDVDELNRYEPGALLELADAMDAPKSLPTITRARLGYQRRLTQTPGVIITVGEGEKVDSKISIQAITYDMAPVTDAHFERLRAEMITPDDWQLMERVEVWMHARQLALGFHSAWDPRPPEEWRMARRAWNAFVRNILARSRTLDSPLQVANACDAGSLPDDVLNKWRAVEPTFKPNVIALWHDDSALKLTAKWMEERPGIVWTEHVPFAERLAEMTGAKYYGAKGLTKNGEYINDADNSRSIVVSIDANKEGRNLQHKWHRNLVTSPPHGSDVWQQFIARTHRTGQLQDIVVDVLFGCLEHAKAWRKALTSALLVHETTGANQKLLQANVSWPSDLEIECFEGARWREPIIEKFTIPGT